MRNLTRFTGIFGILSLATVACGGGGFQDGDDSSGPSGTVTPGGGNVAPDAAVPPGCDVTKTPSQDACVVNETLGVFVAPPQADADASSDGTRAHPFRTMQAGIDAAKASGKRVYASAGVYAEQITLADGVSMFGNLDAGQSWAVVAANARVNAPASPAARADGIKSATRIEHIDLVAPDGDATNVSSIALVSTASPGLTIANATLHAGRGFDGDDGAAAPQLSNGSVNGADGIAQHVVSASLPLCSSQPATVNTCVGASGFSGGSGGAGGWGGHWVVHSGGGGFASVSQYQPPPGQACSALHPCVCGASPGEALTASASTAQGGYNAGGADPGPRSGASGAAGVAGTNGSPGVASISMEGGLHFAPGDGVAGTSGAPGQGGGGGMGAPGQPLGYADGTELVGGVGASGGAGGCPGLAGVAGKGGGASIAALVSDGATFDSCILEASDAGNGGRGTLGSDPTSGGSPGLDYAKGGGTAAGSGGAGGASGWSGSGAGGWSIGVASHGAAPTITSCTTTIGKQGAGVGAITGGTKTIPATLAGQGAATVSF